MDNLNNTGDK